MWSYVLYECSSSSRTCHHVIVTEITTASWKQSLQPVPFSLIMWWATLDYINQFVYTHTRKVCVSVCLCKGCVTACNSRKKAFTFAHLLLHWICCVVIIQMRLVKITKLLFSCIVLLFITLLLHTVVFMYQDQLSRQMLVCHNRAGRPVTEHSEQNTISQNSRWCHLTITPLLTTVPLAMFTSHNTLQWGN